MFNALQMRSRRPPPLTGPSPACVPQVGSIPKLSENGTLNYSFAAYIISYFVVVNWTLLQACLSLPTRPLAMSSSTRRQRVCPAPRRLPLIEPPLPRHPPP